MMCTRLGLPN